MRLAISGAVLVSRDPEAWSLQLVAIDLDPGTKALPVVTHDLELSCDAQELAGCGVTYFYCEFFHISFIVSAGPGDHELLHNVHQDLQWFDKFIDRKTIKRDQTSSYHIWDRLSSLELEACGLQLFSFFNFFLIQYFASRRFVGCLSISDILTVVYFIISWPSAS